ncbi:unnamed protein product [Prorocentrum cordatum]|uniref:Uncharacterized protein n=1 Tax=Prorocentrum cordatum TaxID=2364126 RepID=A0ABN9PQX2_9DINO|nr:unnamed protein product [Polarella glacialis]
MSRAAGISAERMYLVPEAWDELTKHAEQRNFSEMTPSRPDPAQILLNTLAEEDVRHQEQLAQVRAHALAMRTHAVALVGDPTSRQGCGGIYVRDGGHGPGDGERSPGGQADDDSRPSPPQDGQRHFRHGCLRKH